MQEASQNTDFDVWESLGIVKALQIIQGELVNITRNSTEINKHIQNSKR